MYPPANININGEPLFNQFRAIVISFMVLTFVSQTVMAGTMSLQMAANLNASPMTMKAMPHHQMDNTADKNAACCKLECNCAAVSCSAFGLPNEANNNTAIVSFQLSNPPLLSHPQHHYSSSVYRPPITC